MSQIDTKDLIDIYHYWPVMKRLNLCLPINYTLITLERIDTQDNKAPVKIKREISPNI
ncbi:MAG: hypothetical protein NC820_03305 [Candidatus Omnitrophica bacterium]|nr:hypothetical protein [Candidatus Omnitrophota bacterium]